MSIIVNDTLLFCRIYISKNAFLQHRGIETDGCCVGGVVTFYDGLTVFIGCDHWIPVQSASFVCRVERVEVSMPAF